MHVCYLSVWGWVACVCVAQKHVSPQTANRARRVLLTSVKSDAKAICKNNPASLLTKVFVFEECFLFK